MSIPDQKTVTLRLDPCEQGSLTLIDLLGRYAQSERNRADDGRLAMKAAKRHLSALHVELGEEPPSWVSVPMLEHARTLESQVVDATQNADAALALCAAIRAGVKSVSASIVVLIDEL